MPSFLEFLFFFHFMFSFWMLHFLSSVLGAIICVIYLCFSFLCYYLRYQFLLSFLFSFLPLLFLFKTLLTYVKREITCNTGKEAKILHESLLICWPVPLGHPSQNVEILFNEQHVQLNCFLKVSFNESTQLSFQHNKNKFSSTTSQPAGEVGNFLLSP